MRRVLGAVLFLAALAAPAACDSGGDGASAPTAKRDLPPSTTKELAALFDERLRPLGWRVQRGGLEEQHLDTAVSIPPGRRHLAVYLRPTGEPDDQDYIDGLASATQVFLPEVFEDYPGLASFDVCLEPTEADDPSPYPKALTQVAVTRAQAGRVPWASTGLTAVDVVAASKRFPNDVALFVAESLEASPQWRAIDAAAAARK